MMIGVPSVAAPASAPTAAVAMARIEGDPHALGDDGKRQRQSRPRAGPAGGRHAHRPGRLGDVAACESSAAAVPRNTGMTQ